MPEDIEQIKMRLDAVEQEVFRNRSLSLVESSIFNSFARGNLQIPKRDALPATCRVGELCEVSGAVYSCSAQDTWSKLITSVSYTFTTLTAGEAIDASSASKWVYIKASDGKVYLLDTDADESTYKMIGVVAEGQNVSANASVIVGTAGIVGGFSGLTTGDRLYASASAGVAGTAPVLDQGVEIGIAVSATQVYIVNKGLFTISGTDSIANQENTTVNRAITIGFRPRIILIFNRQTNTGAEKNWAWGMWNDGNHFSFSSDDPWSDPTLATSYIAETKMTNVGAHITVTSVTATGFTFTYTIQNVGGALTYSSTLYYIVIG